MNQPQGQGLLGMTRQSQLSNHQWQQPGRATPKPGKNSTRRMLLICSLPLCPQPQLSRHVHHLIVVHEQQVQMRQPLGSVVIQAVMPVVAYVPLC
jgi:hypothetical protein